MARQFTLTLETKSGIIHDFAGTVDGRLAISGDGTAPRKYTRKDLPDDPVKVRLSITGVPGSQYLVKVHVSGAAEDSVWKYTLDTAVQGVDFDV